MGTSWLCLAWSNFLISKRYGRIAELYSSWLYLESGAVVGCAVGLLTGLGGWVLDGMSWSVAAAWGGGSVIVVLATAIGQAVHQRPG